MIPRLFVQGQKMSKIEDNLQEHMLRARDEKSSWAKAGTVPTNLPPARRSEV
jgi:1,6-anhydro-N-acetylmuramate kinase